MNVFVFNGSRNQHNSVCHEWVSLFKTCLDNNCEDVEYFIHGQEKIDFCSGCKNCFINGTFNCSDAMDAIRDNLLSSDIIILVSPVYNNAISGSMKTFLDRIACWTHLFRLAGKYAVIVTISDRPNMEGASNYLKYICEYLGLLLVDCVAIVRENITADDLEQACANSSKKVSRIIRSDNELIHIPARQEALFQAMKKEYASAGMSRFEEEFWQQNLLPYKSLLELINQKRYKLQ